MIVLARAPFLPALAGLVVMLSMSGRASAWVLPPIALFAAFGTMACSYCEDLKRQWRAAAAVLVVLLPLSSWIAYSLTREHALPSFVRAGGVVTDSRPWGRMTAVSVKTPQGNFLLKLPFATLTEGDRILIEGTPRPFRAAASRTSDFREDRFWYARGMTAQLASAKTSPLPAQSWNIHRWRNDLHRFLMIHMPSLTGAYLDAAWTGKRDAALSESHRAWGTSHLLAVSGFHVGIVMAGASFLFKRGKRRVLCLSVLLWLYIFLTGAPASAVRAGLMLQTALLGELAGRPGSAVNSVSLAAVILLAVSPFWFWDIGWRLSVLAALVIAAVLERGAPGDWRIWLFINPLIWLVTFPQVSETFDSVPVVGLLINFVAPPFFGFALSAASLAAFVRFLNIPVINFLTDYFLYIIEGAFLLWGRIADAAVRLLPWQLAYSPFLSYCCAGIFITLLCRAFFTPWRNVAVLAPLGSLFTFLPGP